MIEELIQYALENPNSSIPTGILMIAVLGKPIAKIIKSIVGIFTSQQEITSQMVKTDEVESKTMQILATALTELAGPIRDNAQATQQILLYMKRQDKQLEKIDQTTIHTNEMVKKASGTIRDVGVVKLLLQLLAAKQGINITPLVSVKDRKFLSEYRQAMKGK